MMSSDGVGVEGATPRSAQRASVSKTSTPLLQFGSRPVCSMKRCLKPSGLTWLLNTLLAAALTLALQGRPAVVQFHDALLAGWTRPMLWTNLNRWKLVSRHRHVLPRGRDFLGRGPQRGADDVLARGAAFSKKRSS